ncbi:MAG: glycosyltransferase family 9 protein [Candidatus Omnitrophota bacterium]
MRRSAQPALKRILLVRPDRVGDVLLSSPSFEAARKALPEAFLIALVAPHSREIVDLNPHLNGYVLLDKKGNHRGLFGMLRFVRELRRYHFDTAVVLHGTRRVHLALALAGIPLRVGYDRKWGFLLTRRLKDVKVFGEKHEAEYSLDLLRALGLTVETASVYMPTTHESDVRIERFLEEQGVGPKDRLVAIHPGASSVSKRWMSERFAEVGDCLREWGYQAVIVSGPQDAEAGRAVLRAMKRPGVDACGQTTVRELASLFKRAELLISNDSGPVHVAVGVGTPVVSIFGRNQPGLSQKRWGPLGKRDVVLQKEVGCSACAADDCPIDFECLRSLTVEEVLEAARRILGARIPTDS